MIPDKKDNTLSKILNSIFSGRNVFLHGPGGVGKSFLLRNIAKILIENGESVYLTATTGVAAVNLSDNNEKIIATTVHRFAGMGVEKLDIKALIARVMQKSKPVKRWRECTYLIIDEISMLGSDMFNKLSSIAKFIRKNDLIMGGIKIIASGDFLQLPPVKDDWLFNNEEWIGLNLRPFILENPYRYEDKSFFDMLLRIRMGKPSDEDLRKLTSRVKANMRMQNMLETLVNEDPSNVIKPTIFFSKRVDVDNINQKELEKLKGECIEFIARDNFVSKDNKTTYEEYTQLLDDFMPRSVSFKVGAQVMLKINLDTDMGLANGSRGVVTEIIPGEAMIVTFICNGISVPIRVDMATKIFEDKHALASRTQIPFVLAYAMTIHKSQGCTLNYIIVDLGSSIFLDGQAYVAISRCKNLKGLFISELNFASIKANSHAIKYAESLIEKAKMEDTV